MDHFKESAYWEAVHKLTRLSVSAQSIGSFEHEIDIVIEKYDNQISDYGKNSLHEIKQRLINGYHRN
ncbi:hypothetical protein [Pseudoalteromonas denitrificans]|uniref:Uncharacterized protein n=1 Tax=Pseudoalteromonas denitrificans DSM 6059 TaxID=1123010 RepID=A0A1I1FZM2_9GAMM|nr:hypothetical protein [Pseudoalteromonas denitrificans]SFC04476.1 hypothetical protein SAMN02745724_00744 [Pseudoalteromonas denitrificans DSM 6059]